MAIPLQRGRERDEDWIATERERGKEKGGVLGRRLGEAGHNQMRRLTVTALENGSEEKMAQPSAAKRLQPGFCSEASQAAPGGFVHTSLRIDATLSA